MPDELVKIENTSDAVTDFIPPRAGGDSVEKKHIGRRGHISGQEYVDRRGCAGRHGYIGEQ